MFQDLQQHWPKASKPKSIVVFGAGSIVTDAHLPAYAKAGYSVAGIYDPDLKKARAVAAAHGTHVFSSREEAVCQSGVVFDLATPPDAHAEVLAALPKGAAVLIQKPMGSNLAGATEILKICRSRHLLAAVNFQLRFAPMMLALQDAVKRGLLGEIVDFDAWLALNTPWELWKFLETLPRVEISLHSIHYLDVIRALLGDPLGVHAKSIGHPSSQIAQTRTAAILDYGDTVRCALSINHNHAFGRNTRRVSFAFAARREPPICSLASISIIQKGSRTFWKSTRAMAGRASRLTARGFQTRLPAV